MTIAGNRGYGNTGTYTAGSPNSVYELELEMRSTEVGRFRPMPGKILVKPDDPVTMKGSIHLPETSIQRSATAVVVRVGKDVDPDIQEGMTVYVAYWAACSLVLDDMEYRLYTQKDVGGFLIPST